MYQRGLFPLSADPVTWGHLDVIQRAGEQCQEILVAVLHNPAKKGQYVFTAEERVDHIKRCLHDFCPKIQVRVIASDANPTDLMLRENCDVIFRGVRDEHDRAYEEEQLLYHEMVLPEIRDRTIILEANPKLRHVQSTVARNFAEQHLDATGLVPMHIQSRLWRVLHGQKVIGVTGVAGVGKTTLIRAALEVLRAEKLPAHHLDLATLSTELLNEDSEGARVLKEKLAACAPGELPQEVQTLYMAHLSRIYRAALKGRSGVIFVEGTSLVEDGLCHWTNNNVIVVKSTDFLPPNDDNRHQGKFWGFDEKYAEAAYLARKEKSGLVLDWENNRGGFIPGLGGVIVAKIRGGRI